MISGVGAGEGLAAMCGQHEAAPSAGSHTVFGIVKIRI